MEGEVSTNTIVLRCAQEDRAALKEKLLNLPLNAIGKNVEFIPYRMLHQMTQTEKQNLYYLQNQHITEHGAIVIQGLLEAVMKEQVEESKTLLEWLQEKDHIEQVEKSGTPGVQKWWIITRLEHKKEIELFLNTTVKDNLTTFHPGEHDYKPPNVITKQAPTPLQDQDKDTWMQQLKTRLNTRKLNTQPILAAPTHSQPQQTYTRITRPSSIIRPVMQPSQDNSREIKEIKEMMKTQTMNIKSITTQARTVATSSLTPETNLTKAIKQITVQQNAQFQKMMQDMIQLVFQQIFMLIQTLLPGRPPDHHIGQGRLPTQAMFQNHTPAPPTPNLIFTPHNNHTHSPPETSINLPVHPNTVAGRA